MIDAEAGHGKTWLALSAAYAVAAGQNLLGWECARKARTLYVDGELPGELLQQRIDQLGPALPATDLLWLTQAQFGARGEEMIDLGTPEARDCLDRWIEQHEIELIVLDSVSTLVRSGVDNDVESWRAIQTWSLKHRARGRSVIYLHHHGRSGKPRGTSSREIVLDARIKLAKDLNLTTDNETALKLEFAKAREFHGADAAPVVIYLSTPNNRVQWRHESVKASTTEQVKKLLQEGWSQVDIAAEIGVTKGRVSQIVKEHGLKPASGTAEAETEEDAV